MLQQVQVVSHVQIFTVTVASIWLKVSINSYTSRIYRQASGSILKTKILIKKRCSSTSPAKQRLYVYPWWRIWPVPNIWERWKCQKKVKVLNFFRITWVQNTVLTLRRLAESHWIEHLQFSNLIDTFYRARPRESLSLLTKSVFRA